MGKWFFDEVDLSTLASNVENRSAGWSMPAKRGDNRRVPGRHGSRYREKAFDETNLTFNMWAKGCLPDGTMPDEEDTRTIVRDNLDKLTKLFGSPGLHRLVRPDEGVMYGRKNLLPNPSFENAGGFAVVAENVIANSNLEYTDGTLVTGRKNYADNPTMEDASRNSIYRTNLVRNPMVFSESHPYVWRRNLITNSGMEVQLLPWRGTFDCNISRTNYRDLVWPPGGNWSMKAVYTGSVTANFGANSNPIDVTPGLVYAAQFRAYNKSGGSRDMKVRVTFRQKDGTFIENDFLGTTTMLDGTTALISGTVTAPALAAYAIMAPTMQGTTLGDTFYADRMMFEQSSTVTTFFNGTSVEDDGFRYRWSGDTGNSISEEFMMFPLGWGPGYNQDWALQYFGLTTGTYLTGSTSGRCTILQTRSNNEHLFRLNPSHGCVTPGNRKTAITGKIWLMVGKLTGTTARKVKVWLSCYDADGTFLGHALQSGSDMPAALVTLNQGEWTKVDIGWGNTRVGTATVCVEVDCGETGTWVAGDTIYFDSAIVEVGKVSGDWFSGDSDPDDTWNYEWTAAPHDSPSVQLGYQVVGWQAGINCTLVRVDNKKMFFGLYGLRMIVPDSPDQTLPYGMIHPLAIHGISNSHTASIYARPVRTMNVQISVSYDLGATWTSTSTSCTAGVWTRCSVTAVSPSQLTDPESVWIRVGYPQGTTEYATQGDYIDFDCMLFEATDLLLPYFDGDSGDNYKWSGEPFHSVSVSTFDEAWGWMPYKSDPIIYRVESLPGVTGNRNPWRGSYYGTCLQSRRGIYGVTAGRDNVEPGAPYSVGIAIYPHDADMTAIVGLSFHDINGRHLGDYTQSFSCPIASAWTRCEFTTIMPMDAVVAAPFVYDSGSNPSVTGFDFDGANFGKGTMTTYHDGDDVGWEWNGPRGQSDSFSRLPAPAFWSSYGGAFEISTDWHHDRVHCGKFVSDGVSNGYMIATREKEGSAARFHIIPGRKDNPYSFAVTVRALVDCEVRLALVPSKWSGHRWLATSDPVVYGEVERFNENGVRRIAAALLPSFPGGDATHFQPAIYVSGINHTSLTFGDVIYVDNSILSDYELFSGEYQDGSMEWNIWTGDPDASMSYCYGPSRQINVETTDQIDFNSIAATLAKFSVNFRSPDPFWSDAFRISKTFPIGRNGSIIDLDHLRGATAPMNGALITIEGAISRFTLTDMGSGAWNHINATLSDNDECAIENGSFTVEDQHGRSMISTMSHGGSGYLLPLTLEPDQEFPRLKVEAHNIGDGASITVTAARKFYVA